MNIFLPHSIYCFYNYTFFSFNVKIIFLQIHDVSKYNNNNNDNNNSSRGANSNKEFVERQKGERAVREIIRSMDVLSIKSEEAMKELEKTITNELMKPVSI